MKKSIFLTAIVSLCLLFSNNASAQSEGFNDVKGTNLLNVGIGLGTYGLSGTGGLPILASFEHGFTDKISGGASLGFVTRKWASDWRYTYIIVGARASYHFSELLNISNPKLDVYGGAGLLYRRWTYKYKGEGSSEIDYDSSGGDVDLDLHAGGRYMFNDRFGGFAEVGYGISPLQIGFTMKF